MSTDRGWYSRGYLPHIDASRVPQFLTWRLDDSMPANVLEGWIQELKSETDERRRKELARLVESYCDAGHGSCRLRDGNVARIVQETLFHDHLVRYTLHAWVVMPNHVHVLLTPLVGVALQTIARVSKSVSSTKIHKQFGESGRLWAPDFFDRMIRDERHFDGVRHYLEWNPVKAGLCSDPKLWPWSSANDDSRHRLEAMAADKNAG